MIFSILSQIGYRSLFHFFKKKQQQQQQQQQQEEFLEMYIELIW